MNKAKAKGMVNSLVSKLNSPQVKHYEGQYIIDFKRGLNGLFHFRRIENGRIKIDYDGEKIEVKYEIFFTTFFVINCFITVFILASMFQDKPSLIFRIISFIFVWSFYFFYFLIAKTVFKARVESSIKNVLSDEINISKQQLKWMNSDDKCPACGHNISIAENLCQGCGLSLKSKV